MHKFLRALLPLFLAAGVVQAEQIPNSQFSYGNWQGAAYSFDNTGDFSHCVISASYVSGDMLFFTVNRQATVTVAIASPSLQASPVGQQFPVAIRVDGRAPFFGTATVLTPGFAGLEIVEFERAMETFMRGYAMTVEGAGLVGFYDLKDTFRALEATRGCAVRHYTYTSAPPTMPTADKTANFQLASMVISELGIRSFRYLSQQELVERNWENSVAWTSPEMGVSGMVLIVARNSTDDLRLTDAADTQFLANGCLGDYATSARAIVLDGSRGAARELRLVCQQGDKVTETFLSKFFSGSSIVYNMLQFDGVEQPDAATSRRDESQNATLRAASFMLE